MTEINADRKCPVTSVGAGYDPFTEPQLSDPFGVWDQARRECPVFYSDKIDAWVVTRYADVVSVLGDFEQFSSVGASRGFSELTSEAAAILAEVPSPAEMDIVPTDPPRHTKMRRFIQLSFLPKRIAALEPEIRAIAHSLIDTIEDKGECEFYRDFAYPFPLSVVTSLVGIPGEDVPMIKRWVEGNMALKWGRLGPADQLIAAQGRRDYYHYLHRFVTTRRSAHEQDFVAALVAHSEQSDDPLTEPEMVGQISSLMSAGHETTANFLTLALDTYLSRPGVWESLISDPSAIATAVEETLRLNGPVQSVWRTTTRDATVGGVQIPTGARLSAVTASANRDEAIFEHAAEFDAERRDARKHIAFGRGIHSCAGSNLARMEIRIALEILGARLPGLRRMQDGPLVFSPSALQRAPKELHLAWD